MSCVLQVMPRPPAPPHPQALSLWWCGLRCPPTCRPASPPSSSRWRSASPALSSPPTPSCASSGQRSVSGWGHTHLRAARSSVWPRPLPRPQEATVLVDPKTLPVMMDTDDVPKKKLERYYRSPTAELIAYLDFNVSTTGVLSGVKVRV